MTWWPRSLLWRTVLLITALLVVAHFASLGIFLLAEQGPRAHRFAQYLVSVVNLTRTALITSHSDKRIELLSELSGQEGIRVYVADPDEEPPQPPNRTLLRMVDAELKQQLGPDTHLATVRDGVRGLWISFKIDEDGYWIMLPSERIDRQEPVKWISWGTLVLVLALAGAYLIVALITRPLQRLAVATRQIGRGAMPPPLQETGVLEMQALSRAFNQMASDLKRADDDRAMLLAGISHDLRTPLSRIRLGVEMLPPGDDMLREGMVKDIEEIDAVIGQFLEFARSGSDSGNAGEADLSAVVKSVVERYERQGRPVSAQPGPPLLLMLRVPSIQRLLANLIDNALRYAGTAVEVRTAAVGAHAVLSVLDRGPGISPDQAERMLQPFTRLDTARSTTSSGLGLAIVDRIARMHGGSIRLLQREGGGLEARVELPLQPAGRLQGTPAREREVSAEL
jgi:two-component system, OmpR family, osmolarity sensor histidine kinase EnvZ